MITMDRLEVNQEILRLKKQNGRLLSNVMPTVFSINGESQVYKSEKGILAIIQETYRKRAFFAAADEETLVTLLGRMPEGTMLEYLYRKDNGLAECFASANVEPYAIYVRRNVSYTQNPYLRTGEDRYRKMLTQLYDPSHCERPVKDDIPELIAASEKAFDPLCDEIFTPEQWENVIENNQCLICRENQHIFAYYVYRKEGKRLYSNLTFNDGPANLLYNMERRVFEEMWDTGIHQFYYWQNIKNEQMNKRRIIVESPDIETLSDDLWNAIYIKKS